MNVSLFYLIPHPQKNFHICLYLYSAKKPNYQIPNKILQEGFSPVCEAAKFGWGCFYRAIIKSHHTSPTKVMQNTSEHPVLPFRLNNLIYPPMLPLCFQGNRLYSYNVIVRFSGIHDITFTFKFKRGVVRLTTILLNNCFLLIVCLNEPWNFCTFPNCILPLLFSKTIMFFFLY